MRVLISGSGVAGPSLALLLARQGHEITIIERSPDLRANGQQIDIRKEGIEAAKRMDIFEDIKKCVTHESGMRFVNGAGKVKAKFPALEGKDGRQGFTSEYEIMRGDLVRILHSKIKDLDLVSYKFGVMVESYDEKQDGVEVKLSDGTTGTWDVLVAADGQSSRIRKMLLTEEENKTRNLGVSMALFIVPRRPDDEDWATVFTSTKKRVALTRYHSPTEGQACLGAMGRDEEVQEVLGKDAQAQKELFQSIFTEAGWKCEQLIADMMAADDFYAQRAIQVQATTWHKGRVVLLGDAGYGPTPLTGMGTSLALIGSTILAGSMGKYPGDLGKAFAEYEEILRPYVEMSHKIPGFLPDAVYPETKRGVMMVNLVLGVATRLGLAKAVQMATLRAKDEFRIPQYAEVTVQ